jgi:hypothetical protein
MMYSNIVYDIVTEPGETEEGKRLCSHVVSWPGKTEEGKRLCSHVVSWPGKTEEGKRLSYSLTLSLSLARQSRYEGRFL